MGTGVLRLLGRGVENRYVRSVAQTRTRLLGRRTLNPQAAKHVTSARMLKHTARSIAPSVTKLFNLSLCSGQLPVAWKQSLIVPVPKSPVATTPNNYRPISLLSILSKLLERHIYSLVATHLELYHPLSNAQWGFQTGKSTTTALLSTTHEWLTALEQRKEVSAVFFDLKKAFDSVPHKELMSKLQQLSLDSHVLHWISNYLTCRCQKVVVSGETSRDSPVLSGSSTIRTVCMHEQHYLVVILMLYT